MVVYFLGKEEVVGSSPAISTINKKMKNQYLISYISGLHGEFFCGLIASDPSYYPPGKQFENTHNTYSYNSVVNDTVNFFGPGWPTITDEVNDYLDKDFSDKHLLFRSHSYEDPLNINLRRLKKIKFYTPDWLFPLTMKIIKMSRLKIDIGGNANIIRFIKGLSTRLNARCISEYDFSDSGFLEIEMASSGVSDPLVFTRTMIEHYQHEATISSGSWTYINVRDMLLDPNSAMSEWKQTFDLQNDLDSEKISEYHSMNCKLIETEIGISYDELRNGDYESILSEYISSLLTAINK